MITKGIIKAVNVNSNTYSVRIPYFEMPGAIGKGTVNGSTYDATLCCVPGILESYKVNDVVFVGFEDHQGAKPIILGRLYVNRNDKDHRGAYRVDSLDVEKYASLPTNTTIGGVSISKILEYMRNLSNISDTVQQFNTKTVTIDYDDSITT
jgi:hypothetical protein